jgi:type I restriction enzyme S subunit
VSKWPVVPLSAVVSPVDRSVPVLAGTAYRTIGVKWWGEGAYERITIDGSQTAAKTLSMVRKGDLIINKIWVRHGSVAVASEDVDGCAASGEFPTFQADEDRILPQWLHWICKTRGFWTACDDLSRGTSGKNRIRPERFLTIKIPLPPTDEQHRLVTKIDAIEASLEAAQNLRRVTADCTDRLVAAEEVKIWPASSLATASPLEQVTTFLARGRQTKQGASNHYLIKTQHVQMGRYIESTMTLSPEAASKVAGEALARSGDTLIACSAAGCLGRVAFYSDGTRRASTDSHVAIARPRTDIVSPEYLYAYLRGAQGQVQLRSREKGDWKREKVGFRLTELNVADMRNVPVPVPSQPEQRRIVEYVEKVRSRVDAMKDLQVKTAAELDAMLPAILDRAFHGEP